jgi:hypothetical protein
MRRRRESDLLTEEVPDCGFSSSSEDEDDNDRSEYLLGLTGSAISCSVSTACSCRASLRLREWLAVYVEFLLASHYHQDHLLKALQWTTWLASVLVASSPPSQISTDLTYARYTIRLLEWPIAIQAALTGAWTTVVPSSTDKNNDQNRLDRDHQSLFNWVGRFLSWSMVGYYPTEHIAFLLWMLPLSWQNPELARVAVVMSSWSCRCWLVYLVADLVQTVLLCQRQQHNRSMMDAVDAKESRRLHLQVTRTALFLLPCIHWYVRVCEPVALLKRVDRRSFRTARGPTIVCRN